MKRLAMLALIGAVASPAMANEYEPAMRDYLTTKIAVWAHDPVVISAVLARNAITFGYDSTKIEALDRQWRDEVGSGNTPLITPVLQNPASDFLRAQIEASGGEITEIFVMDAAGLNVAASDTTSDYWQGDEDKFAMSFGIGAGASHFSEVEFDESTQAYQGQISFTIVDPATGVAIGAMTVGVDAESLLD